MHLLPRVLAVVAACAIFPAAHAACTAATIKGYFAASGGGSYFSTYAAFGVAHVYFNGVNAVSISNYKEGQDGSVRVFTGYGSYQVDQYCRGTASIALKENGVAAGTISLSFVASGTPTSPQLQALISNPATGFTGGAVLNKINL
ncbi:hypothetical protein [Noviluteimonas gilva]|uniref:Uncharacterized protein n=1 Tax=Noviluteimonas gilva TaxID=2682097 RepID=A0A7C9I5Q9_9GAMM|nr:hypothetical protein [Lysobacter gilvus]MUV14549.1 hypothetical protein [Lysobacter gilvus]